MDRSNQQPSEEKRNAGNGGLGDNPWRAAGLVGTVGADLAVCLGAGYWLGSKVDAANGTGYWSILGLVAGLIVGAVTIFFLIRVFTGGKTE
jgi:ATP synthase protein I